MPDSVEARRFAEAVKMADEGIALMRQNFCRRHPDADDAEIDRLLGEWLAGRPLDAPGRVVPG